MQISTAKIVWKCPGQSDGDFISIEVWDVVDRRAYVASFVHPLPAHPQLRSARKQSSSPSAGQLALEHRAKGGDAAEMRPADGKARSSQRLFRGGADSSPRSTSWCP